MCKGERPIGAAKGKQSDIEALCQDPPPQPPPRAWVSTPLGNQRLVPSFPPIPGDPRGLPPSCVQVLQLVVNSALYAESLQGKPDIQPYLDRIWNQE